MRRTRLIPGASEAQGWSGSPHFSSTTSTVNAPYYTIPVKRLPDSANSMSRLNVMKPPSAKTSVIAPPYCAAKVVAPSSSIQLLIAQLVSRGPPRLGSGPVPLSISNHCDALDLYSGVEG